MSFIDTLRDSRNFIYAVLVYLIKSGTMSEFQLQKEIYQTVLLGNGIVYVKPYRNITIEEDLAHEIIDTCFENMEYRYRHIRLIIDMALVVFVTEEARELLANNRCVGRSISHLALVSNGHLSNVISTLTIRQSESTEVEMRMFKSAENAVDWLQDGIEKQPFLEAAS